MAISVVYGNYTHPPNEAAVQMFRQANFDPTKQSLTYVVRWVITGTMIGGSPFELGERCRILEQAYSTHHLNAAVVDLSTGLPLQALTDSDSYSGVRVMEIGYPRGDGPEFATERMFQITLEADYMMPGASLYVAFSETLTMWGGGPKIVWPETTTGDAEPQILVERQTYFATQSGMAIGRTATPPYPLPIWPGKPPLVSEKKSSTSGQLQGIRTVNYQVNWEYQFQSNQPLYGAPNVWPLSISI